jgi:alpha-amylase
MRKQIIMTQTCPTDRHPRKRRRMVSRCAPALLLGVAGVALAEPAPRPMIVQWYENSWESIERRMPDFFEGHYGAVWLPPISKVSDPSNRSPGYDPFDRFDIGSPGDETLYGTENDFRAMVDAFHRANGLVYIDIVLNHNGGRTGFGPFLADGDYPGVYIPYSGFGNKSTGGDWGDFHNGTTQSLNPGDPNYDLWEGDLLGLVDIDQASNLWMVRQPVDDSLPQGIQSSPSDPPTRIPEGNLRDKPDPDNARFYPDLSLTPTVVNVPAITRFGTEGFPTITTPAQSVTIYPFNTADPMEGDPVPENVTAYLSRWIQWTLEDLDVDGFRIDAAKHTFPWFFDEFIDTVSHNRWSKPDGTFGNPFQFGESTASDNFVNTYYIRKDAFANRDNLDLAGAGNIRNIIGARGFSFVGDLDNTHFDLVDGFNDGSLGVNHIHSHDNGTRGQGFDDPLWPYEDAMGPWAYAYLMLRTGEAIIYYNAKEFGSRPGGFNPRQGVPSTFGYGSFYTNPPQVPDGTLPPPVEDERFTTLAKIRRGYGRGIYNPRAQAGDSFVFSRAGHLFVGISDSYAAPSGGTYWQSVTFNTGLTPGTRLVELTGNASDPEIDPNSQIAETLVVGASGLVTMRIPNNVSPIREHSTGYVAYGLAAPSGTLEIVGTSETILPDPVSVPTSRRRLATIPVVTAGTFDIQLTTSKTEPLDPAWDDNALFRINEGFADFNNNGTPDDAAPSGEFDAYEQFLDVNQPLFGTSNTNGLYRQTINTDDLREGFNYISVVAFRNRPGGTDPVLTDFRQTIYVDREDPEIEVAVDVDCFTGDGAVIIQNPDRTASQVYVFVDLPEGDPIPTLTASNIATRFDRSSFRFNVTDLTNPTHSLTIVAVENPGTLQSGSTAGVRQGVTRLEITPGAAAGDINNDGVIDQNDVYAFFLLDSYLCRADLNQDDVNDGADAELLEQLVRANEVSDVTSTR